MRLGRLTTIASGVVGIAVLFATPFALACDGRESVAGTAKASPEAVPQSPTVVPPPVAGPTAAADTPAPAELASVPATSERPAAAPSRARKQAGGEAKPRDVAEGSPSSGTLVAQATPSKKAAGSATGSITGHVVAKPARYRANAVLYLDGLGGGTASGKTAHIDQKGMQFEPRVLAIQKGAAVEFLNSDPAEHSVYTPDGEKYDLGKWNRGEKRSYTFKKAGVYTQLCKIHPAMIGYVVVLEGSYFAVSGEDGAFEIRGVPAGEHTLSVWHERLKAQPVKVVVEAGKAAEVEINLAR